jgi:hypothetical protein
MIGKSAKITIIFVLLSVLAMVSCTKGSPPSTLPAGTIQPSQTMTPAMSTQVATAEVSPTATQAQSVATTTLSASLRQAVVEPVYYEAFWWADNQTLYYSLKGETTWRSYDVQTGITQTLEAPPLRPGIPAPEILNQVPEDALSITVSPSRRRTLYMVGLSPTPTPESNADGETEWVSIPSELWLIENGKLRQVGPIENCIENYLWSDNERVVVAQGGALLPCQAYAWLVDLETPQVISLFPREGEWLEVIDLSPSGQRALVRSRNSGRLYILDITSSQGASLDLAQWAWGKWLDEQHLIVGENHTTDGARWTYNTFWLYDVESRERVQILGADMTPALATLEFTGMTLSPDRRWLAFIAGLDLVSSGGEGGLWVVRVDTSLLAR